MEKLINDIFSDKKVVVITGAGISTLSGASDFRSSNGIYSRTNADEILRHRFLKSDPDGFYEFYSSEMMFDNLEPNIVHNVLVQLEDAGYIKGIITQNIDMLHQKAGSKNVINIHGDGDKFYCMDCNCGYTPDDYRNNHGNCVAENCNGVVRPDIILNDEFLDYRRQRFATMLVNSADVLIVLGSSLTTDSIKWLLNQFTHADDPDKVLYIVNNQPTTYDSYADMYGATYKNLGEVFERLEQEVNDRKPKVLINQKPDNSPFI